MRSIYKTGLNQGNLCKICIIGVTMRQIARIDIKNEWAIKGINLEGLRKVGNPNELAKRYYQDGIHEIVFMDAVASLYDRNNLFDVIERASQNVFVPIALGGGIRTLNDVSKALDAGADKVVVNTAAVRNIGFIGEIARKFGSQCIIGSIEAKKTESAWEAYIENGREPTGLDVVEWALQMETAGIGELLVTSIDQEGTKRGFDIPLITALQNAVNCPIIVSGGYGKTAHLDALLQVTVPSGVAYASALHYNLQSVSEIKLASDTLEAKHGA